MAGAVKEKNRYCYRYLIEHTPGDDDHYTVWDLRMLFTPNAEGFACRTLAEAQELCQLLAKL